MPVSVIIPTYRRPTPLAECVESILRGTLLPDEIVIVGREGDTETERAIPEIQSRCPASIKLALAWVSTPGHMPPVQTGASVASGDLVALLDDDVRVTPEWLAALVPHFADPQMGVAGGRVLVPNVPVPRVKGKPGHVSWYGKSWGNIGAYQGPSGEEVDAVMEGNSIWRRELLATLEFDQVLNFADAVMYGLDLCLQAKKRGFKIVFEPRALVYHHVAPRPAGSDRRETGERLFGYCRNYTYVLFKELPAWRRPIFLAWWFLIGERGAWGAAALAYDFVARGVGKQRNVAQAWRGKLEGIRQWRNSEIAGDARKMKILIYSNAFAPDVGGMETYVMLLAQGLTSVSSATSPIEVTVATRTAANDYDDSQHAFRVVRQPGYAALAKLIRESNVIQIAGPCLAPLALSWLLRKKVVVEHHGYQASCPNGLLLREPMKELCPGYFMQHSYGKCVNCVASERGFARSFAQLISTFPRRWLCNRVQSNIAISENVARRLALPRTQVIYYGLAPVPNGSAVNLARTPRTTLTFGYVGRLVAEKGLGTLVEAADSLAKQGLDFQLTFIGDGPERAALETAINNRGLRPRTSFTGFLTGKDLAAAAGLVDVVVMPSIWEETFGLSALEHLARGRLVVAADIGGLAEVVDDAGLKFPPGDSVALSRQLARVVQNPRIIEEYRVRARTRAGFFALDKMIALHVALYKSITRP